MPTLLDIPEFLKKIIKDNKLPCNVAIELKKLKDEKPIRELVSKIIEENITFE